MPTVGRALLIALAIFVLVTGAMIAWRANVLNVRGSVAGSVAAAFDDPPPYPGYAWTRDGREVRGELGTSAGPGHCGWETATLLTIGWPPSRVSSDSSQARQYIRDPKGDVRPEFRDLLGRGVELPSDARPTGHTLGSIRLFLSPTDQDRWIYLVSPHDLERWPRSDPMTLCM